MAVRVKNKGTQLRKAGVVNLVREFVQVKKMKAMWEAQEKELKKRIDTIVDAYGEPDEKGSLWYTLPDGVTKLYRQRRVTQTMNEDVAENVLTELGFWEECVRMVPTIDEDAVLALAFQKKITEEQLAEMYEETVTYALYVK